MLQDLFCLQQCGSTIGWKETLCFCAYSTLWESGFEQQKGFYEGESFSSLTLISFFKPPLDLSLSFHWTFPCNLRANPVLCRSTQNGATILGRYTTNSDDMFLLVRRLSAKKLKSIKQTKINPNRSVWFGVGFMEMFYSTWFFRWTDRQMDHAKYWFGPSFQLKKNWSGVLENFRVVIQVWS